MATRMQQRRGTATMWTNANPILGVAEIGYETDTNKFKIGDGTNRWADLSYFVDLDTMIEGAPGLLNSLDEIAAAIGDDPAFFTTIATGLATKAPLASPTFTGTVSGVTKAMVGLGSVDNTSDSAKPVSTAQATAIATAKSGAEATASADATTKADAAKAFATAADTTLRTAVTSDIANAKSEAISTASSDATTKANNAKSDAEATAASALSSHEADTTNIHGIADTSALATKTYADNAASTAVAAVIDSAPGALDTLNELAAALSNDASYATTITNALALKAPLASPTFTGTVSGVTKTMVGLGSVDNTADSAKPVSTAQATAIATAKSEAISTAAADATSKVAAEATARDTAIAGAISTEVTNRNSAITTAVAGVVAAAPEALDTLKELADALTADESTAASLATLVGTKAPIASPTFTGTVSGVTKSMVGLGSVDNTTDANKPVSSATQTALDLKLNAADIIDGGGV